MAKPRAPQYIRDMRQEGRRKHPTKPVQSGGRISFRDAGLSVVGAVSAAITFYTWLYSPLSITANDPLNGDALSAPFTLTNSSGAPILNVAPSCVVNHLEDALPQFLEDDVFTKFIPLVPKMDAGEQDSIYCKTPLGGLDATVMADITISAAFAPGWAPFWTKHKIARFVTVKRTDGKLEWIAKAVNAR